MKYKVFDDVGNFIREVEVHSKLERGVQLRMHTGKYGLERYAVISTTKDCAYVFKLKRTVIEIS